MSTLIDTNVLLDVLEVRLGRFEWAVKQLENLAEKGDLVFNQIIYGEASVPYATSAAFERILTNPWLKREDLPWDAAFYAGKAYLAYRQRGGGKANVLPDFLIGAHALAKGHSVLTRDPARFRTYFPSVTVIAPDTHP